MLVTFFLFFNLPNQAGLLFSSDRSGNSEIYVILEDGGEPLNLTNHVAHDNWPVWSPDGKHILFQSRRADKLDVWMMDADGENPKQLTFYEGHDYLPSWIGKDEFSFMRRTLENEPYFFIFQFGEKPVRIPNLEPRSSTGCVWRNSKEFAFTEDKGTHYNVVLANRNGNKIMTLMTSSLYVGCSAWSPDGKLAFSRESQEGNAVEIGFIEPGQKPTVVLSDMFAWYPRFSPDGKWLVFTGQKIKNNVDYDIFALELKPGAKPVLLCDSPYRDAEASWKPNI